MKIIINESQIKNILSEAINSDFYEKVAVAFPDSVYVFNDLKKAAEEVNCDSVKFDSFNIPAGGISLHNGIILNERLLKTNLLNANISFTTFLYCFFHELAHQYQFKKYGTQKMYATYNNDTNIDDAINWLISEEATADRFAISKTKQVLKNANLTSKYGTGHLGDGNYSNVDRDVYKGIINYYRNLIKGENINDIEKISEMFFNSIKNNIGDFKDVKEDNGDTETQK